MHLETTVGPVEDPVTVAEAKHQIRESSLEEDLLIKSMIQAATAKIETFLRRRLITQTVIGHFDGFCELEDMGVGPVQSVNSVVYRAFDDSMVTVDPAIYRAILSRDPAQIVPKWGRVWPIAQPGPDTVQVEMVVGYGAARDVPAPIKTAIVMLVGHYYANREAVTDAALAELPMGVCDLTMPYVLWV